MNLDVAVHDTPQKISSLLRENLFSSGFTYILRKFVDSCCNPYKMICYWMRLILSWTWTENSLVYWIFLLLFNFVCIIHTVSVMIDMHLREVCVVEVFRWVNTDSQLWARLLYVVFFHTNIKLAFIKQAISHCKSELSCFISTHTLCRLNRFWNDYIKDHYLDKCDLFFQRKFQKKHLWDEKKT